MLINQNIQWQKKKTHIEQVYIKRYTKKKVQKKKIYFQKNVQYTERHIQ